MKDRDRDERDLEVMKALEKGETYKQIQKRLRVSPTIISAMKKELNNND